VIAVVVLVVMAGRARRHQPAPRAVDLGAAPPVDLMSAPRIGLGGLIRSSGQPAADVEVTIGGPSGSRSVRSGPDGTFAFAGLAEGRYALRATRRNEAAYLDAVTVGESVDAGGGLLIDLRPASSIAGKLRDRAGRAVAGGSVTLLEADGPALPRVVESDADGAFAFSAVLPGNYVVTGRAAGYYPGAPLKLRVQDRPLTVELRLELGATLAGRVLDEQAKPVAGAHVEVAGEAPDGTPVAVTGAGTEEARSTALDPVGELGVLRGPLPYPPVTPVEASAPVAKPFITDADGAFRVTGVPAGKLVVVASHPDFARGESLPLAIVAGAQVTVNVVLSRGATVRGRVVDERGAPLSAVEVSGEDGRTMAFTDERGEYKLEHVVRALMLTARRSGYLPASRKASPSEASAIDFQLARAEARLAGEVVDDRDAPVAGARIEVAVRGAGAGDTAGRPAEPPRSVASDRSGRFVVENLPPGPYRVTVTHADFAPVSLELGPGDAARIQLLVGGGIDGDVRDARLGGVPAGVRLELVANGKSRPIAIDRGRFVATAVPPGRATLRASAPGYVPWAREVEVPAGTRPGDLTVRDLRVELERGGTVSGRIRDDDGAPVAGVTITAGSSVVRSDADGNFRLDGVAPGRVRVHSDRGALTAVEEVEVRPNDESRIELRLH
jgi:hypothetical protein